MNTYRVEISNSAYPFGRNICYIYEDDTVIMEVFLPNKIFSGEMTRDDFYSYLISMMEYCRETPDKERQIKAATAIQSFIEENMPVKYCNDNILIEEIVS